MTGDVLHPARVGPSAVADDHPLDSTDDLALALGGASTGWTGRALRLIAKSDPDRRQMLCTGYMAQLLHAYDLWQSTAPAPTAGDYLAHLEASAETGTVVTVVDTPAGTGVVHGNAELNGQVREAVAKLVAATAHHLAAERSGVAATMRTVADAVAAKSETLEGSMLAAAEEAGVQVAAVSKLLQGSSRLTAEELAALTDWVDLKVVVVPASAPGPVFACPRCGRTSSNPADYVEGYCGACHNWTGKPAGGARD